MIRLLRFFLPVLYIGILASTFAIFLFDKGGWSVFSYTDPQSFASNIFPMFGLFACILIWAQIMIGSQMNVLRSIYPGIETFHRGQGIVALLLALSHPSLLFISLGLSQYISYSYVSPDQRAFAIMGQFQLVLLLLTVGSALLRRHPFFKDRWRIIHYLNYLVFCLVLVHSWNLGSDLAVSSPLKILWIALASSAAISLSIRFRRNFPTKEKAAPAARERGRILAGEKLATTFALPPKASDILDNTGRLVTVEQKNIALFKQEGNCFALADRCTHAGASLSRGSLSGFAVQCPAHGAKFDIRTGAVLKGPAKIDVPCYQVAVNNDQIEVELPR